MAHLRDATLTYILFAFVFLIILILIIVFWTPFLSAYAGIIGNLSAFTDPDAIAYKRSSTNLDTIGNMHVTTDDTFA
jgi:glucan phosphoethanolaminetransferase (alkaline phosphatase superfamily)